MFRFLKSLFTEKPGDVEIISYGKPSTIVSREFILTCSDCGCVYKTSREFVKKGNPLSNKNSYVVVEDCPDPHCKAENVIFPELDLNDN